MDHVIEPLEACSEPRVLSFLLGPGEDLGSLFPSIRGTSRAIVRKGLFWLLLVHAIWLLEARGRGKYGRKSTFSPGWTLIGGCRGNPAPTHIMKNIRWTEALSLRGKKYHILRKQCRTGSGSPKHAAHRNGAGTCRSVGRRASLGNLPHRRPAQSNIEKCFQTILRTEPSHIDSMESAKTKDSRPGIN